MAGGGIRLLALKGTSYLDRQCSPLSSPSGHDPASGFSSFKSLASRTAFPPKYTAAGVQNELAFCPSLGGVWIKIDTQDCGAWRHNDAALHAPC